MTLGSDDTSAAGPTPSSEKDTLPPKTHDFLTKDHKHNTEDSASFNSPATLEGKPTPPTWYFLDKVPPEIRALIYEQLLRSRGPINKEHKLNSTNKAFLCKHYSPIDDIDSTILRTCRSVYDEARPILYGLNHFYSDNLEYIEQFAHDGLTHDLHSTDSAFRRRKYGRLSEVRNVSLRLSQCSSIYRTVEQAEGYWKGFIHNRSWKNTGFPALEKLFLDFSAWNLTSDDQDESRVKHFIKKFGEAGKLKKLMLKGVTHPRNLHDFFNELVKDGGKFVALDNDGRYFLA